MSNFTTQKNKIQNFIQSKHIVHKANMSINALMQTMLYKFFLILQPHMLCKINTNQNHLRKKEGKNSIQLGAKNKDENVRWNQQTSEVIELTICGYHHYGCLAAAQSKHTHNISKKQAVDLIKHFLCALSFHVENNIKMFPHSKRNQSVQKTKSNTEQNQNGSGLISSVQFETQSLWETPNST